MTTGEAAAQRGHGSRLPHTAHPDTFEVAASGRAADSLPAQVVLHVVLGLIEELEVFRGEGEVVPSPIEIDPTQIVTE